MGREHERKLDFDIVLPKPKTRAASVQVPSAPRQEMVEVKPFEEEYLSSQAPTPEVDIQLGESDSVGDKHVAATAAPDFLQSVSENPIQNSTEPVRSSPTEDSMEHTLEDTVFSDDNPFVQPPVPSVDHVAEAPAAQQSPDIDPETGLPIPDYMKPFLSQ